MNHPREEDFIKLADCSINAYQGCHLWLGHAPKHASPLDMFPKRLGVVRKGLGFQYLERDGHEWQKSNAVWQFHQGLNKEKKELQKRHVMRTIYAHITH